METTKLFTIWKTTCSKASLRDLENCFSLIIKNYSSSTLHYHTLKHVDHLIRQIQQVTRSKKHQNILINVALFHDVIYIAGRKDNEQKSANFAKYWLSKLEFDTTTIEVICTIIRATNTHQSSDPLTQLFLDMDLSILGQSDVRYQDYLTQIRKEHAQFPCCLYNFGRTQFLKTMLSRAAIFSTATYYKAFEATARKNLTTELHVLNNR